MWSNSTKASKGLIELHIIMTQNMRPGGLFSKDSCKYLTISKLESLFLKYQDNILGYATSWKNWSFFAYL